MEKYISSYSIFKWLLHRNVDIYKIAIYCIKNNYIDELKWLFYHGANDIKKLVEIAHSFGEKGIVYLLTQLQ
jgi:hypothetical protein